MTLIKTLILSMTIALTGIIGMAYLAPSASADSEDIALCEKAELECIKPFPNPTTIVGHATNPKLLTSVGTVECEKSLAELSLLNEPGETILGDLLTLSFEGTCHLGSTKCTVTVSEVGGISIEHGANKLEWIGRPVALPLGETPMDTVVNVKCGFLINCTYTGGEETVTTATNNGEGVATAAANKAELKRSAGFCPEVSEWDATYVGLGSGLWLESASASVEREVLLCEKAELECRSPFENATTIVAHAEAPRLLSSSGTVECEKSLAELSLLNEPGETVIGHLLGLAFEGNCHLEATSCAVTTESLGLLSFVKEGALEASAKSTGGTQVRVKCGALIDCKYSGEPALKAVSSEAGETQLIASKVVLAEGKGTNCPKTSEFDATYAALGTMWIESPRVEKEMVLCEKAELECQSPFPKPTMIVGHANSPKLLTSAGTVECEKSLAELSLLNANSETITGHLQALSYEGSCHLGETSCTVTTEALGSISFSKTGLLEASAKSTGGTQVRVKCGALIDCKYSGEPALKAVSSEAGETQLIASKVALTKTSGTCPEASELDVTYTALGNMWIESPGAPVVEKEMVLCEKAELECQSPFRTPTTIVTHATSPKLLTSVGTVECEKSLAELSLLNANSETITGHLQALSYEGSCHLGETSCTLTTEALGSISFVKEGVLEASAKSTGGTQVRVKCGALIDCKYSGEPALKAVSSEAGETQLIASKVALTKTSGTCPEASELDVTYTALGNMWIESPGAPVVEKEVVLCEKAELECQSPAPKPTTIIGHATNPKLLTSVGTVECEKSLAELSLLNANSETITGHLLALSFEGNCHRGTTSCTITIEALGSISFSKIGPLEASAKSTGGTQVRVKCSFFLDCTYSGEPSLKAASSKTGETQLIANEVVLAEGKGTNCPETSKLDATYTTLGSMWIESPGATVSDESTIVWCKKVELECKDPFPNPTTLAAHSTDPKILTNLGTVECGKSLMELTILNQLSKSMVGHVLALWLEGCNLGGTSCTVTIEALGLLSFEKAGLLAASVRLTGGTEFTVKCGSTINCKYGGELTLRATSGESGVVTLSASGVRLTTVGGTTCPKESSLDVTYAVLSPGLWIES
jgi:myo-inositol catabolism protein IolC